MATHPGHALLWLEACEKNIERIRKYPGGIDIQTFRQQYHILSQLRNVMVNPDARFEGSRRASDKLPQGESQDGSGTHPTTS